MRLTMRRRGGKVPRSFKPFAGDEMLSVRGEFHWSSLSFAEASETLCGFAVFMSIFCILYVFIISTSIVRTKELWRIR